MEQLGIETSLLLAQIINFSIIVFVLSRLLYKPILTMLEKRRKEIEEGLALTDNMRQEEERLKEKREKVLEEARKDAKKIMEEARSRAREVEKDVLAGAHKANEEMKEKAEKEIEALKHKMKKDIEMHAVGLAVAMTKQLVASVLTARDQHTLIEKQVKELARSLRV